MHSHCTFYLCMGKHPCVINIVQLSSYCLADIFHDHVPELTQGSRSGRPMEWALDKGMHSAK